MALVLRRHRVLLALFCQLLHFQPHDRLTELLVLSHEILDLLLVVLLLQVLGSLQLFELFIELIDFFVFFADFGFVALLLDEEELDLLLPRPVELLHGSFRVAEFEFNQIDLSILLRELFLVVFLLLQVLLDFLLLPLSFELQVGLLLEEFGHLRGEDNVVLLELVALANLIEVLHGLKLLEEFLVLVLVGLALGLERRRGERLTSASWSLVLRVSRFSSSIFCSSCLAWASRSLTFCL